MSSKRKSRQIQTPETEPSDDLSPTTQRQQRSRRSINPSSANRFGKQAQDDHLSEPDEDSPVPQSQRSKKRKIENGSATQQRNGKGKERALAQRAETVDCSDEEEPVDPVSHKSNGLVVSRGVRDKEGYLPGSIVRVALRNFVTYSSVEFSPGPYLNMIIGPNGTGKSTLVCAIVLGLGFAPSVLDRASEVKLFIKSGTEEGSVEIELKGHPGKKNYTIKLNLILANNSRVFEVNGKRTTIAQVQEIVQSFNIQANNLCCFLPQEKVSKFAEMKEPELLRETQKVAGHPKLYEWHELLIEDGKSKLEVDAKLAIAQRAYKDTEKSVESLRIEVERFKERKAIEDEIEACQLGLEQNKYQRQKLEHDTAKAQQAEAKEMIANLEAENAPLNDQKTHFKQLANQFDACKKKVSSASTQCKTALSKLDSSFKSTKRQLEEASEQLIALKHDEQKRKDTKSKLQAEIDNLAKKVANPVPEPDHTPYQEELQSLSTRIRQISNDITTFHAQQKETYEERRRLIEQQNNIQREIKNMESVTGRKEADLKKFAPNVFAALQIMREFRDEGRFRGKAFEPVRLEISPKHPSFDRAVEACLNRDLLNTFIFTDPHDYELMAERCNDHEKLRVNLACMRAGDSLSNYQHPIPLDRLKQLGFDDYIINLINGPDEVLAHICNQSRLNMVPVVHNPRAQLDETRFYDRNFPIKSWIRGTTRYNISYSSYGSREMIIKSMELQMPKILNVAGVDNGVVQEKKHALQSLEEAASEKEEAVSKLRADETALRNEHETLARRKKEVDAAWTEAKAPHLEYLKYVVSHKSKVAALEKENAKPTLDQERGRRKAALFEASKAHGNVVVKMKNLASQLSRLSTTLITLNLRILQHSTDQKAFEEIFNSRNHELTEAKVAYEENEANVKALYKQAKDTAREFSKMVQGASEDVRERLTSLSHHLNTAKDSWKEEGIDGEDAIEKQQEHIQGLLSAAQMSLEGIHPVDVSIMERYGRFTAQLKKEKKEFEGLEREAQHCQSKITKTYDQWRPRLDELIESIDEKFDAAFKRMGCLGHIVIVEDPDYEKWGIEVQVSFRDNEPLVRLDPHRQSGGERSLSTIMYLMSLTELSKSPFSLVDEINQGMDRRAERLVHDQLVETTCKESASQYFLITPKLLFGLKYHPMMRVLCVNNGDWIPPDFKFGYWLDKAKARRIAAR
ncbi:Structural maintenance of chromosomes protein 5 [Puccinia graminis f. sp. tritici]|uniref:Structural maintenance of chromosomes protein 5 n=1 Tax=Puccinia graminis f. sp. tritici TaxID=56615 RepID=A0A5B0NQU6_PUCGR|nr:Structural maintenance of chromosomes protein 5 [Puccinia graminis f. sp. tritici]KAA1091575.1 Structural maintenance of chromosomes protein 5 [Puccinia graminis f. sp. tritici]